MIPAAPARTPRWRATTSAVRPVPPRPWTARTHIIVSFLGFAPADDPEVIVLLGYDWPQPAAPGENTTADGIYISGGNMAAPMAGELSPISWTTWL